MAHNIGAGINTKLSSIAGSSGGGNQTSSSTLVILGRVESNSRVINPCAPHPLNYNSLYVYLSKRRDGVLQAWGDCDYGG